MSQHHLIAACAFGLEALVKRELANLGYDAAVTTPGRLRFTGDDIAICRANLWSRFADRILIEVATFPSPDFESLFETTKSIDWSQWIPCDASFPVVGKSRLSQLTSVPAVQRSVKKAVVESLKTNHLVSELPETGPKYQIEIALLKDRASITIDTTGPSLHKRGYRSLAGIAPLKETLAAAMVDLSVWNPERPLIDPFCGSGTIPIEAALIGQNLAPGLNRRFAAQDWTRIDQALWNSAVDEAMDEARNDVEMQIIGSDHDPEAIRLARIHAEQAGVARFLHLQVKSFDQIRSKREFGCIITNPPYGERIRSDDLEQLHRSFPAVLQRLPTWSHYVLTSESRFEKIIQATATRRRKLFNGRIECTYFQFLGPKPGKNVRPTVDESNTESSPGQVESTELGPVNNSTAVFGGLTAKDQEQADLLYTRLVKRLKHLRRWPTKRGVSCFRVYERDIPELPFIVDRYGEFVHVTEYERPHDRDLGRHAAWLELMKKTTARAFEIPIQRVYMKSRERLSGLSQFQKRDSLGKLFNIDEGGLHFCINLSDYVDTGMFLDHRNTRAMVRKESSGKRFLNLFAYTGSFSVYAASGGAVSTETVDLSDRYLNWARKNMTENGFTEENHRFVQADSIEYLKKLPDQACFDLAVVDPPTYSNSKGLQRDWDVQKNHVELLHLLHAHMESGGVVYFSSNFRRFKLSEDELEGYEIREISSQTVPDDFRNRRIHRCWRMVVNK